MNSASLTHLVEIGDCTITCLQDITEVMQMGTIPKPNWLNTGVNREFPQAGEFIEQTLPSVEAFFWYNFVEEQSSSVQVLQDSFSR